MSFEALKKNRQAAIDKLLNEAKQSEGDKSNYIDDRFWKPTLDKSGNGYAVIRFLPVADGEEVPWVRYWDHGFKGPTGRWYIEKSLTSIGESDPVSDMNSQLWNSGREEDKDTARSRKRRLHYVSNILVVSDPAAPENEGKVFLFKYGKKIHEKIMDVMQPEFEDEKPVNPFDFWGGANFKLKIRQVEGYRNYDKSTFDSPSEMFNGDEDKLREVYNSLFSLKEFTDPSTYKSYDELKKKLMTVLGESDLTVRQENELDDTVESTFAGAATVPTQEIPATNNNTTTEEEDEEEDDLKFFSRLAKEG
jgi:hypothetical protein